MLNLRLNTVRGNLQILQFIAKISRNFVDSSSPGSVFQHSASTVGDGAECAECIKYLTCEEADADCDTTHGDSATQ